MYICTYIHTYTHTYIHAYIHTYTYVHIWRERGREGAVACLHSHKGTVQLVTGRAPVLTVKYIGEALQHAEARKVTCLRLISTVQSTAWHLC